LSSSRSNLALILAGLLVGASIGLLILFGFGAGDGFLATLFRREPGGLPPAVPEVNSAAPDFELDSLAGQPVQLADFRGQPVLINFWASWCGPCLEEMPLIETYSERYASDFKVLAINNGEPEENVIAFVDEVGFSFEVLLDPGRKVSGLYQVRGLPTTFFVDSNGEIRYQHIGPMSKGQLVGYLEEVGVGK
jgi:thiol-disulfide isomerase/thioredoxin